MQANSPGAFFLSTLLHSLVAGLIFLFTYVWQPAVKDPPKIFDLVAGEGDNYMATEAPALGVPGGIKLALPEMPVVRPDPAPVQAAPIQSAPPEPVIERAPPVKEAAKPAPVKPPETIRNFAADVKRISEKREKRLVEKARKEREVAERKAKEEDLKNRRLTKEEFDRQNKTKATTAKTSGGAPKIAKIDAEGIRGGVIGGSTANKTGGAGGKALTREDGEALDLYFSLLKRRLREALDKPPGLSDTLVAIVEVRIGANGVMSGARIARSSGSDEFDQAALAAITRVRSVGPRPDGKSELISIPFRMREEDEG